MRDDTILTISTCIACVITLGAGFAFLSCSESKAIKIDEKLKEETKKSTNYSISSSYLVDIPNGKKNIFVKVDRAIGYCNCYDPQTNIFYQIPIISGERKIGNTFIGEGEGKIDATAAYPITAYLSEEELAKGYLTVEDIEAIESRVNENSLTRKLG